ncbi:MAG: IS66 family insertion sequence element accessory protein TnpB [Blautia sp.]|nr:IS66 family insertion sequence element accessory protein TnpB [Blautia sp.]
MRKCFDGLMAVIRDTYQMDPYANALYLFCGRDSRKLKALHYDKDGFVLLQKRLDGTGRFQWSRNALEARLLSRQEYRWLLDIYSEQELQEPEGRTSCSMIQKKEQPQVQSY